MVNICSYLLPHRRKDFPPRHDVLHTRVNKWDDQWGSLAGSHQSPNALADSAHLPPALRESNSKPYKLGLLKIELEMIIGDDKLLLMEMISCCSCQSAQGFVSVCYPT